MPLVTDACRIVTQQDPDIASLTARLGLRGMRYVSFGNRPIAASPATARVDLDPAERLDLAPAERPDMTPPPAALADHAPPAAERLDLAPPPPGPPDAMARAAFPASPDLAAAPAVPSFAAAPPPRPADYPLIAAALGRPAAPQATPADPATLVFLGLRAAQGR
jgi:hypothetical protein